MDKKKKYSTPQLKVELMYGLNHLLESTYVSVGGNDDFSAKDSNPYFENEEDND